MKIVELIKGYEHQAVFSLEWNKKDLEKYGEVQWTEPRAVVTKNAMGDIGVQLMNGEEETDYMTWDREEYDGITPEDKYKLIAAYQHCLLQGSLKPKWENWSLYKPSEWVEGEMLEEMFAQSGRSNHSPSAHSLGVILQYCEDRNLPYLLKAIPDGGYTVERKTESELMAPSDSTIRVGSEEERACAKHLLLKLSHLLESKQFPEELVGSFSTETVASVLQQLRQMPIDVEPSARFTIEED